MGYALSPRSRLGLTLALIVTLGACQVTDATAPNPDSANSPTTSAPAASDDAEQKVETAIQTTVEATGSSDATITSIQQPPVWVKLAPDLTQQQQEALAQTANDAKIDA